MDRHNGLVYFWSYVLIFLAGPVFYLGVVQAALCDKLGASAAIANLPSAAYAAGAFAPLVGSWLVPHRYERTTVVWMNAVMAVSFVAVAIALVTPLPAAWKLGILIAQGLCQGLAGSVSDLFTLQCLGRGTSVTGRSRILQRTYAFTPAAAIIGSMGVQYILNPGLPSVRYPYDFALVFGIGAACAGGLTVLSGLYRLTPPPEEPRRPLIPFLWAGTREFLAVRPLLLLWLAYLFWNCSMLSLTNITLYVKHALGRDPSDFSGAMMAIQFGGKALCSYFLGWLAMRRGLRTAALGTFLFQALSILWAWTVPGYSYLLSFAWMGAAMLAGVYVPNFVLTLSKPAVSLRNLSVLSLAGPASAFAPSIYGALAERFGFEASFAFGLFCAFVAIALLLGIRENPK
jgi:hypothetical protein